MLYKNGQTIFDKIKAEGGFIKVKCLIYLGFLP